MSQKHLLLILDGYGIAEDPSVSAIAAADTPFLDTLFSEHPHATLEASGLAVGLPEGLMGNSEVGHTNLGAGRIVYQEITRIDKSIADESFFENAVLTGAVRAARASGGTLHLFGLVSDGGVHASLEHLLALIELARREGLTGDELVLHAFTDGRDTAPEGGTGYLQTVQDAMTDAGVGVIGTVIGRYWAMDRDQRWERTEKAYRAIVDGVGEDAADPIAALAAGYARGTTDEFAEPVVVTGAPRVASGDAVLFFNFRADRARQITRAFIESPFEGFERTPPEVHYATFAPYHKSFDVPVAFPKADLSDTLGEVVSRAGKTQLRAAESEKYPHVTFFFNGGREVQFEGESRILAASPKVATYDLQPEMSAPELASRVAEAIRTDAPDLVVLNFANPDMVGHTGVFEAAVHAVEAASRGAETVITAALERGYSVELIADHGNADKMRNPDGTPHTAHTTALVPHLVIAPGVSAVRDGTLGDIAPTILKIMGLSAPEAMTGTPLV